jgi:hypothetical protein
MSGPNPSPSNSWRVSPFTIGCSYRVRKDFEALRDSFAAGEILIYQSDAYSRYDNCTGYFFSQSGSSRGRIWDLMDDDPVEKWKEFFEEIPPDA